MSSPTSSSTSTASSSRSSATDNQLQTVPATDAYGLLTEPFVFVVGGDGVVKASFELIFTPDEIDARWPASARRRGRRVLEPDRDVLAALVPVRHPDRHGSDLVRTEVAGRELGAVLEQTDPELDGPAIRGPDREPADVGEADRIDEDDDADLRLRRRWRTNVVTTTKIPAGARSRFRGRDATRRPCIGHHAPAPVPVLPGAWRAPVGAQRARLRAGLVRREVELPQRPEE